MVGECFQSLEITKLRKALAKIHERVSDRFGRIEVTRDGCEHVCVLISKAELESLERALEILSETDGYRSMCDQVARVVAECGSPAPAALDGQV